MSISRLAFFSALPSRLSSCLLVLICGAGCRWNGIRPIHDRISLEEQARQATAVIVAEPIESRSLQHRDYLPASAVKGRETEFVPCDAVQKVLKVRQVLRGPIEAGSALKIYTYEIEGVPGIANQPAIFLLRREKDFWRPFTDFGLNTIALPGFPDRPLVLSRFDKASLSEGDLDRLLIDGLLNPRNASDWPMFNVVIERLVSTALNLAAQSGILANDPDLITDKLEVLIKAANPGVAAAARKELLEMTTMCKPNRANRLRVGSDSWPKRLYGWQGLFKTGGLSRTA